MEPAAFTARYGRLYHLTFARNLDGIEKLGLLSAKDIAHHHKLSAAESNSLFLQPRKQVTALNNATIRDQHVMSISKMSRCLDGVTTRQWLDLINSRTFFFVDIQKAQNLAKVYKKYENVIIETDTQMLLKRYAEKLELSRINLGSFLFKPAQRGRASFVSLPDWNSRDTPAEVMVHCPLPNILSISRIRYL